MGKRDFPQLTLYRQQTKHKLSGSADISTSSEPAAYEQTVSRVHLAISNQLKPLFREDLQKIVQIDVDYLAPRVISTLQEHFSPEVEELWSESDRLEARAMEPEQLESRVEYL